MKLHTLRHVVIVFTVASVLAVGGVGSVSAHPTPPEENQGGQEGCVSMAQHNPSQSHENDCGNQ